MPFGLNKVLGTFQRVFNVIPASVKWKYALVYLDNVIIFSRTAVEHLNLVQRVLWPLSESGVTLILNKFFFFTDTVDYLGHFIRPGELYVGSHTADAIDGLKEP